MSTGFRKTVLVIEDNADDAFLIRRAFAGASCNAFVCRNTSEARAYLLGAGMYSDRNKFPFPQVAICDLRLGEDSGAHFVAWVRSRHELNDLPVIILSGSASTNEFLAAENAGANAVFHKPGDSEAFQELLVKLSHEIPLDSPHEVDTGNQTRAVANAF
jgi:CheY-like chemotaxis protein